MSENAEIAITVIDAGNCPVLKAGQRMIYAHPEVLKESDRICGEALVGLMPALREVGPDSPPARVGCPAEGCGALFEIAPLKGRRSAARKDAGLDTNRLMSAPTSSPFLSRIEPATVREIAAASEVQRFERPTVFIQEGEVGEALFIVAEGEAEAIRRSEDGHEVVLAVLGKGECLGEMSLLTGQPATATVRTRGDRTALLVVFHDKLEYLLARHPAMHREFSRIIAERLYRMNVMLEAGSSRGISGRLSLIGAVDLVQMLSASRRTGTLIVESSSGKVLVGFSEGEVVSAVGQDRMGEEAFFHLLEWRNGDFAFEGGEPERSPGNEISAGTMGLLMEGMRRIDEREGSGSGTS